MNRYYFQINSRVIYDVQVVEAPDADTAYDLWCKGHGRTVCRNIEGAYDESNFYMGQNALSPSQYDVPEES